MHVDMHAELSKLGLEKLIPAESWPQARLGVASSLRRMAVAVFDVQANAVKKLASKARLCKNQGQEKVFLFVDLRECVLRFGARLLFGTGPQYLIAFRYLPPTVAGYQPVWLDEDGVVAKGQRKSEQRLDFAWWLLAWDRYSLAAAATGQLPYRLAMTHKENIASIAADAVAEGGYLSWASMRVVGFVAFPFLRR